MADEGSGNRDANMKETVRFWRAWKTVHQLCKDRVCDANYPFHVFHTIVQTPCWFSKRRHGPMRVLATTGH